MVKVSVIIPTFGKPDFLEKAIRSVINQSLVDVELIIVDDNNPGTEARILTEDIINNFIHFGRSISYIRHEHNRNGAVARNTGISVARGKYISFLDSDDEYCLDRLAKCFDVMEHASDKTAGVYSGCEFRKNGRKYNTYRNVLEGNFLVATLAGTFMFGTGSNLFIRNNVVKELEGFDESFLRHQDYEFLVRLFKKYSLRAIPEVLVIKNNENLNLPDVYKIIDIKAQFIKKFEMIIQGLQENNQRYIYYSHYISIAEHALKTKQFSIAREYYMKAKDYDSIAIKHKLRRFAFTVLNLIN